VVTDFLSEPLSYSLRIVGSGHRIGGERIDEMAETAHGAGMERRRPGARFGVAATHAHFEPVA
jgi:hypothetical protein